MRITVMVPARERVNLLHTMLMTLYETVACAADVEVILRVDDDDAHMIDYLRLIPRVKTLIGPRLGYAGVGKMMNECVAASTGDLFLAANDDLVFETLGWDRELVKVASQYHDGIFNLGVDTVYNNENFCFPCTSRRVVDTLGCFFDERLLYPDIWLRDVMEPFGRAIRVPQIVIRHAWTGMTADQDRAVHGEPRREHDRIYGQCVAEGRAKIRRVMAGQVVQHG